MKRKRLLIFAATLLGVTAIWRIGVYAQDLASTSAASAAGATLGAAGGSGLLTPGQYAAPATGAAGRSQRPAGAEGGGGEGAGAGGESAAGGGATVTVRRTTPPLRWGPDSGSDLVRQWTAPRPRASRRTTRSSARRARRVSQMTRAQRSRMINRKYQKPAVGYLSWYLPEDRYKVTSKVWQFVTTPNDRYYYRPWAPSMRTRNASRVIGFHTWQDAMIAGYRPDPISRPEPGPQLAYLATLTRGPMLATYFEYVYAGQVTPRAFDANYRYVRRVAGVVRSHRHTRHLVGETVEQVLGAAVGLNDVPRTVGGPPPAPPGADATGTGAPGRGAPGEGAPGRGAPGEGAMSNALPPSVASGAPPASDRREGDYSAFRNRAGGLAR